MHNARVQADTQEFTALTSSAGWLDQSHRSRLCLLGVDRTQFLHGQVTNDINRLDELTGCYAALVNAKGKMESDLFAYRLTDEILLDFEPGLTATVRDRLEKYIIAEDVEIAEAAPHYGLLTVHGLPSRLEVYGGGEAEECGGNHYRPWPRYFLKPRRLCLFLGRDRWLAPIDVRFLTGFSRN